MSCSLSTLLLYTANAQQEEESPDSGASKELNFKSLLKFQVYVTVHCAALYMYCIMCTGVLINDHHNKDRADHFSATCDMRPPAF